MVPIWVLTDSRYLRQRMPHAVAAWLRGHGHPTQVVVADDEALVASLAPPPGESDARFAWSGLRGGDVVVARSRDPFALALLQAAEALGARSCDECSAILRVRDKATCFVALSSNDLPVPPTFLAHRPQELRRVPARLFPILLKPVLGDNARGIQIVRHPGELESISFDHEMVLAQPYLDGGGIDLKLYVAGEAVWAVRRRSPLLPGADRPTLVSVTPTLRDFATACRDEFGLRLFGLDLLELEDGPVIVDVNEFPNYTGVDEAPAVIGRLLVEEAAGLAAPSAVRNP